MRWEADRCATYLHKEAILLRTVSQIFSKYGSVIGIFLLTGLYLAFRQIVQFHHHRLQARYEETGRDKKETTNLWSAIVIHGRKCSEYNSFGNLSKIPVFWYSFLHLKMTGKTHLGLRLIGYLSMDDMITCRLCLTFDHGHLVHAKHVATIFGTAQTTPKESFNSSARVWLLQTINLF